MSAPSLTPARRARLCAGYDLQSAAKRLRVHPRYLAASERHGFTYVLAQRAARLYRCPIDLFLPVLAHRFDDAFFRTLGGDGAAGGDEAQGAGRGRRAGPRAGEGSAR